MDVLRQIRVDEVVTGVAVWAVCGSASTMNLRENPGGEYGITQEGWGWAGTVAVVLTQSSTPRLS